MPENHGRQETRAKPKDNEPVKNLPFEKSAEKQ